jgi:hypothetical protein
VRRANLRAKCLGSAAAIYGAEAVEEETGRKAALKGARLQYEKRMSPA